MYGRAYFEDCKWLSNNTGYYIKVTTNIKVLHRALMEMEYMFIASSSCNNKGVTYLCNPCDNFKAVLEV
jgi:hypothetical protein